MKKNILIFFILFSKFCIAQNLQFQPLENNPNFNECITAVPPYISSDNKYLYYLHKRLFDFWSYLLTPNEITVGDSILYEVTKLNIETGNKQKFQYRKGNTDSCSLPSNPWGAYFHPINKSIYFFTSTNDDSLLKIYNPDIHNRDLLILDSNMHLQSKTRFQNNLQSQIYNNFIVENDSTLLAINFDIQLHRNGVYRYNYHTGIIIDSFIYQNGALGVSNIFNLNDSTIVLVADSASLYIDKNLQFKGQQNYLSYAYPINNVPNFNKWYNYYSSDTSLYYITSQSYTATNYINQFETFKLKDAYIKLNTKINHDSALNAISSFYIASSYKNTDFLNYDNKFCVSELGLNSINTLAVIAVMNFDSTNHLRWKKYIGFDANYISALILATPDSGCMVLVNRKDILNQQEKYDLYYIKLDKNGNQQYDYLPLSLPTYTNPTAKAISIYPNPFTNSLSIKSEKIEEYNLVLYNESGQKIVQKNISSNQTISLENLVTGVYFYTLSLKNKLVKSGILEKK